jgi:hypothetical protein
MASRADSCSSVGNWLLWEKNSLRCSRGGFVQSPSIISLLRLEPAPAAPAGLTSVMGSIFMQMLSIFQGVVISVLYIMHITS